MTDPADVLAVIMASLGPASSYLPAFSTNLSTTEDASSVEARLVAELELVASAILAFADWSNGTPPNGLNTPLSLRDLTSWSRFVSELLHKPSSPPPHAPSSHTTTSPSPLPGPAVVSAKVWSSFAHGAALVVLDGIGLGSSLHPDEIRLRRHAAIEAAVGVVPVTAGGAREEVRAVLEEDPNKLAVASTHSEHGVNGSGGGGGGGGYGMFGIPPFLVPRGPLAPPADLDFQLSAPTTAVNSHRLLRGMQLTKPLLLEVSRRTASPPSHHSSPRLTTSQRG